MSTLTNRYDDASDLSLESDTITKLENKLRNYYAPRCSSNADRCPACRRKCGKFYCGTCVTIKNVTHTKKGILFADKYNNYLRAQGKINVLEGSDTYFNEKTKERRLIDEISKIKEDITEAKKKLEKSNAEKNILNESLEKENEALKVQKRKLSKFAHRFNLFLSLIDTKTKENTQKRSDLEAKDKVLQLQVKYQVSQVLEILPVTLYSPDNLQCNNTLDVKRLLTYLEESANTSYMRGEWEFTHQHEFESVMGKIFKQYLPADGDYVDFYFLNKDKGDDCYDIPTGLGYLVQFINLIAYYADVILPRPLEFSDFNNFDGADFNSPRFHQLIYSMNANIFHLCLSQGVPAKYLHPHRAIPNVIALMYHPSAELGRFKSIVAVDSSANEYLGEVEVPDFHESDDEQNDDKSEADGWEKLTPSI